MEVFLIVYDKIVGKTISCIIITYEFIPAENSAT